MEEARTLERWKEVCHQSSCSFSRLPFLFCCTHLQDVNENSCDIAIIDGSPEIFHVYKRLSKIVDRDAIATYFSSSSHQETCFHHSYYFFLTECSFLRMKVSLRRIELLRRRLGWVKLGHHFGIEVVVKSVGDK